MAKTTKERFNDFIKKAAAIHNNKYAYDESTFVDSRTSMRIICPEHGEFWQKPNRHVSYKRGCPKCGRTIAANRNIVHRGSEFISKAREIHGDKYDYSKVNYVRHNKKVCIICPVHGEFWQTPNNHLQGNGCRQCGIENKVYYNKKNEEQFIEDAKRVHGDKYSYEKLNYVNSVSKAIITCPIHGDFEQEANSHLRGAGCPICAESHLENEIRNMLYDNNVKVLSKYNFDWLGRQHLDLYLPEYNIAIECQGVQHFEVVDHFGGEEKYIKRVERDTLKKQLCDEHGVELIYYTNVKNAPDEYLGLLFRDKEELLKYIFSKKSK